MKKVISCFLIFLLVFIVSGSIKVFGEKEKWKEQEVESIVFKATLTGRVFINQKNPNFILFWLKDKAYVLNTESLTVSEISSSDVKFKRDGTASVITSRFIPLKNVTLEVSYLPKEKVKYSFVYRPGRKYEIVLYRSPIIVIEDLVSFDQILIGQYASLFKTKENIVIKDENKWQIVWNEIHHSLPLTKKKIPPLPRINFAREMVIVVFAGQKPGKGYSIKIDRIVREKNELVVYIEEKIPVGRLIKPFTTFPFQIIKCKKIDLPVVFKSL
ncbi:MAG: protease complex subunit PrcB family protein [Candidatus Aminicenantia bacterium]